MVFASNVIKEVKMTKKIKYLELKKQFDDLIFEIVRTRTINKSTDADYLIEKISPQIDKINNILNEETLRA